MSNEIQPLSPQEVDALEKFARFTQGLGGEADRLLSLIATVRDRERQIDILQEARKEDSIDRTDLEEERDELQRQLSEAEGYALACRDIAAIIDAARIEQEGKE